MRIPYKMTAAATLVAALAAGQVAAQSGGSREEGIPVGTFVLKPSVELGARYDDNIALEDNGQEEEDFILSVAPTMKAVSTWRRHKLAIDAGLRADRYLDNTADNSLDARLGANGTVDVTRATKIDGLVSYRRGHDNRGDDNVAVNDETTKFDRYRSKILVRSRPNRLGVQGGGGVTYANFHDTDVENNDDRDVVIYDGEARLSYGVQRHIRAFVEGNVNRLDYVDAVDDNGFNRDATGYAARVGASYFPSSQLQVSFGVGYLTRTFDDPALDDVSGLDFKGSVNWELPNRLTNLRLSTGRSIAESTDADAGARLVTSVSLDATHDLARTWELFGNLRYAHLTDEAAAGATEDNDYSAGVGVDYVFNPRVKLGLTYDYKRRDSSDVGGDYSNNVIGLRLKVGYLN
ncbi:MAG: hypothetical protein TEF_03890 [Rhizobiales bacterium NRL2]|nr:MAG: hypothetical protein TEF_03890 [Rhizobiales bacterium NRL2]